MEEGIKKWGVGLRRECTLSIEEKGQIDARLSDASVHKESRCVVYAAVLRDRDSITLSTPSKIRPFLFSSVGVGQVMSDKDLSVMLLDREIVYRKFMAVLFYARGEGMTCLVIPFSTQIEEMEMRTGKNGNQHLATRARSSSDSSGSFFSKFWSGGQEKVQSTRGVAIVIDCMQNPRVSRSASTSSLPSTSFFDVPLDTNSTDSELGIPLSKMNRVDEGLGTPRVSPQSMLFQVSRGKNPAYPLSLDHVASYDGRGMRAFHMDSGESISEKPSEKHEEHITQYDSPDFVNIGRLQETQHGSLGRHASVSHLSLRENRTTTSGSTGSSKFITVSSYKDKEKQKQKQKQKQKKKSPKKKKTKK